jgi:16S rRNA (cytidine1402-2'-O)-methyltransferase
VEKGTLYVIPSLIGATPASRVLPDYNRTVIQHIRHYIVENEKSARHFLKAAGTEIPLQEIALYLLDEHTIAQKNDLSPLLLPLMQGNDVGVISEAGCPAIADPGAEVVRLAHKKNIKVVPLVGPSSLLLALMASGFNGQNFSFHGYLPIEKPDRIRRIKELENESYQYSKSQIFIETPYRNMKMLDDLLATCRNDTRLCIARNITDDDEMIRSFSISEWRKNRPDLHKRPTVFILFRA